MQKNKLAFIGGSGIYNLDILKDIVEHDLLSPFGSPSSKIIEGKINGNSIFFLSRHGIGHQISPSEINYRANIECLKQLEVTDIISLSAVGSLKNDLDPGTFVIIDQFIDRTINRKKTFFENGIVAHVPMANPTCRILMDISKNILQSLNIKNSYGGTYLAMEGPQFSSKAESLLYKSWNCDVIGMTNMPEAKLAREAEIRYASISMVTDFDSWSAEHEEVDLQILLETMHKNVQQSKNFIENFSDKYFSNLDFSSDTTTKILDTSIVTQYENWNRNTKIKLSNILKRFTQDNNVS
ncbi:S-methyl-5'-thioadenosine phosphorylase [Pelagibacteraceae bacterium]|nr:S-methyl-5'-thioadenosine phosphorylase [Pelagibacteraceae bacterium]